MKQIKFGINGTAVRRTGQFNSVDFDRSGFAWSEKFIFLLVFGLWCYGDLRIGATRTVLENCL